MKDAIKNNLGCRNGKWKHFCNVFLERLPRFLSCTGIMSATGLNNSTNIV